MHPLVTHIYARLPPSLQSVAASARGLYLRRWRYGAETDDLVSEALERELWSERRWRAWEENRLEHILDRAATRVPYYREYWSARGDGPSVWRHLANWPILEKETVREHPLRFIPDDRNVRQLYPEQSSGTTGKPLRLWYSRDAVCGLYALFEARCRRWNGVSRHDRWAMLGGQLVTPPTRHRPPFWVWNAALNQLYMSTYHLAPNFIPQYVAALERYRVEYALGYSSSLNVLAQEVLRCGLRAPQLRAIVTNAEPLFDDQRSALGQAFRCPVRETYGMAEMVAAASECTAGSLHLWPEAGYVEAIDDDRQPVPEGTTGDLVCTGLLNADMPLIRYRVGDRGVLAPRSATCGCGRRLPVLTGIQGRISDMLLTKDGRKIFWINPIFYGLPLREVQVIQETLDTVRVRFVPAPAFTTSNGQQLIERLQQRLGPVQTVLEPVGAIPRGANGKFRPVVSHLTEARDPQHGVPTAS